MAPTASAARDIQATFGRDILTDVAARSVPVTRSHPHPLPTPPNSISPGLPPHGLRAAILRAKFDPTVPDLDLHVAPGSAPFGTADHSGAGSLPEDSASAIMPGKLAKHHLPEILLNHGPLAIRHIIGYLTTSVPGFASVPPAKARRLVVAALEGRGSGGDGGGPACDVIFEKVGWGRWDARRRGQPPRDTAAQTAHDASPPYMSGIPIVGGATWSNERTRVVGSSNSRGDSPVFSHDSHGFFMQDNEADNMSLDGSGSASCSEAPDDEDDIPMDDDDVTDEEDWAAIGAAGLRAASYSQSAGQRDIFPSRFQASSSGIARAPQLSDIDLAALAATPDAQERDAIQALLRLGSV